MSFFIAIVVVLILDAAVGLMWQDRGLLPGRGPETAAGIMTGSTAWRRTTRPMPGSLPAGSRGRYCG